MGIIHQVKEICSRDNHKGVVGSDVHFESTSLTAMWRQRTSLNHILLLDFG